MFIFAGILGAFLGLVLSGLTICFCTGLAYLGLMGFLNNSQIAGIPMVICPPLIVVFAYMALRAEFKPS